jgi:hypothetical protein
MKSSCLLLVLLTAYFSCNEVVLAANALRAIKNVLTLPFTATAAIKDAVFSLSDKITFLPEEMEQLSR